MPTRLLEDPRESGPLDAGLSDVARRIRAASIRLWGVERAVTIVGLSRAIEEPLQRLVKVARFHEPVLILGESGVGKESFAQALHALGPRAENPFVVLATGQTQCHNTQGVIINCQGTGQDGELRCGKPWPKPRFVQQGEVIIDRLTTLAWRRNADLTGRVVRWQDALRAVQQLNEKQPGAGWRLPNINELESLVDCRMYSPALPVDAVFTDLHGGYWSSTTSVYEPDWAWVLYLDKGPVGVAQKSGAYFHAWAVRSGR